MTAVGRDQQLASRPVADVVTPLASSYREHMSDVIGKPEEGDLYVRLRQLAFDYVPDPSIDKTTDEALVFGVIMEFMISGNYVTLFCSANGDASIYSSEGTNIVGGARSPIISKTATIFVQLFENYLPNMTRVRDNRHPDPQSVIFYALRPGGVFFLEVPHMGLSCRDLQLAGHEVLNLIFDQVGP
jgi:hypothetical protein